MMNLPYAGIMGKVLYDGMVIKTLECIGHTQKRIGERLRKLKSRNKDRLSTGKNKLHNYYGNYSKTGNKEKNSINAALLYCTHLKNPEVNHEMSQLAILGTLIKPLESITQVNVLTRLVLNS